MPNTPPEIGDADTAKFLPRDGLKIPEHISMNDLSYVNHLINNAITPIRVSINYENDPDVKRELESAKATMVGRIDFLLTRYKEDLKNMPEVQQFLELLHYLIEQNQLQHAVNLHQLAIKAFQMGGALDRPGRHLSQEMPAAKEGQEAVPELKLTVFGPCKNPNGLYVGLSKLQRDRLGIEVGETVEITDEKGQNLGVFTVGKGSSEITDHTDLFTANGVQGSATVIVRKSVSTPDKPKEFKFPVTHAVETIDAAKHSARTEKIASRFPDLDQEAYIVLPTAIASELGIKPEPGKTVAPISRGRVRIAGIAGIEMEIAIVPSGTTIGFTTAAAQKLNIPPELSEIKPTIDKGVLVI